MKVTYARDRQNPRRYLLRVSHAGEPPPTVGQVVVVTARDGRRYDEYVGEVVWRGDGLLLARKGKPPADPDGVTRYPYVEPAWAGGPQVMRVRGRSAGQSLAHVQVPERQQRLADELRAVLPDAVAAEEQRAAEERRRK